MFTLLLVQASVKRQLSQRFRNLRRASHKVDQTGQPEISTPSSSSTVVATADYTLPESDYHKSIATVQKQWQNDKPGTIVLLSMTFHHRREWINGEAESISEILEMFPCFRSYDYVRF